MNAGGEADSTVGSLLAGIANSLSESLRILMFADKRQWGPDEFEQIRALEEALDDAKKDFQEMAPLVHGQFYYQNDHTAQSLSELRALKTKFVSHANCFKDWARTGGPINPIWAHETLGLKRELHRAQCRATARIFAAEQEQPRCLGAFQVWRQQKRREEERKRRQREREELPPWQQQAENETDHQGQVRRKASMEELVPVCNGVGRFERLGRHDAAFVCDFCDGFLVWGDLQRVPSVRIEDTGDGYPRWQAKGLTSGREEDDEHGGREKLVVFPPLAIANHMPPILGDWKARILCPYCEDSTYLDQGGEDSEEEVRYNQDEGGLEGVDKFQEHLEWHHTALQVPSIPIPGVGRGDSSCSVM